MHVLIVGGGVAGLATALALDTAGIPATVYEAHPESGADIGAFLTLASNGIAALDRFGCRGVLSGVGYRLHMLRLVDAAGVEIARRPLSEPAFRCLRRAELCAALHREMVRRGIAVEHGRRITALHEDGARVRATFADGGIAIGDLLIGADGLNSMVRTLIDPAPIPVRYAGQRVFYGYTADARPPTEPGRIDMVRGSGAAFGYAVSPAGETSWFARVTATELPSGAHSPDELRDYLLPVLRPDNTPAADIVAATGDRLMATNACDLPSVPRWRTDRVLLIGDAAHAAAPATGQGAALALEDAAELADLLAAGPAPLAEFERRRRPVVEANVAASARMTAVRRIS
jgi:2-polyprenyl-6-methoxyphenol hydroxylase-like FAD-dependent oxidoreductase